MNRRTPFRKSTYSDGGGECVEVAKVDLVAVRDSTDPHGPVLWFAGGEWAVFVSGTRSGVFDCS